MADSASASTHRHSYTVPQAGFRLRLLDRQRCSVSVRGDRGVCNSRKVSRGVSKLPYRVHTAVPYRSLACVSEQRASKQIGGGSGGDATLKFDLQRGGGVAWRPGSYHRRRQQTATSVAFLGSGAEQKSGKTVMKAAVLCFFSCARFFPQLDSAQVTYQGTSPPCIAAMHT